MRPTPTRIFTFRVHWYRLLWCKASVDQPAQMNATTDVISRLRTVFFTSHIYCDTSTSFLDRLLCCKASVNQLNSDRPGFPASECTGTHFSAAKHQFTSQITLDRPGYSPTERTDPDFYAVKHRSTGKLERTRPLTSSQDKRIAFFLLTSSDTSTSS